VVRIIFIDLFVHEVNVNTNPISIPIRADAIIIKSIAVCVKIAMSIVMSVSTIEILKVLIMYSLFTDFLLGRALSLSLPSPNIKIMIKYVTNIMKSASIHIISITIICIILRVKL
jgi:hypothetical protein